MQDENSCGCRGYNGVKAVGYWCGELRRPSPLFKGQKSFDAFHETAFEQPPLEEIPASDITLNGRKDKFNGPGRGDGQADTI